jgi:hypothetical protein
MEGSEPVGVAIVRVWRSNGHTTIRVITNPDVSGSQGEQTFSFSDPDDALEAVRSFVYGWYPTHS